MEIINNLSVRQKTILSYIWEYMQAQGRPPTIREIGEAANISSTSVVNYNLGKLAEKKLVEREAEVSRGLRLSDSARRFFESTIAKVERMVIRVPLAGNIVAGEPIEVGNGDFGTYDEDDAIEISENMLPEKADNLFALRVSGNSMIDAMVNDGDIVILQHQSTALDGDMVAAWINSSDTTTLKHFYHEGKQIRLQPANPFMEPIYVSPHDLQIQGKVVMILRQSP